MAKLNVEPDDDHAPPVESTPLLPSSTSGSNRVLLHGFRRKSVAKLSSRASGVNVVDLHLDGDLSTAHPAEGLAPLFPKDGIREYDGREYIPYREATLVKSVPAFPPYRRKARHRSFYLWWTNEFRHWWKNSRLLVRLAGLYVYSYDPAVAPAILVLDPTKRKTMKKLLKFGKRLGQGGPVRDFIKMVKPFTRSMRLLVGGWRWFEAAPCRRGEVGGEEFMAFVGNRVSRMVARTATDDLAYYIIFPLQRYLFRQDLLDYPQAYHPIAICVCIGILRAVSPFAASFQGSRFGRVLTRGFFSSAKNRWLPTQRIENLNLMSDDCQEKDEVNQAADLVIIARLVSKALGEVQTSGDGDDEKQVVRQHEALLNEGFKQVGAGSGGYAVYQYHFKVHKLSPFKPTTILLHVTPYGPSITDVMPYYLVLEFETSCDFRNQKWSNSLTNLELVARKWQGPQVLEGYCYQGAFFSPHHFAELKEMYDKQLLSYEAACKKLPIVAKTHHQSGVPNDLPTLKKFLEAGKRSRKRNQNMREYTELQRVVKSVAKEILGLMKKKKKKRSMGGQCYAPKGVILYFEGLDCSGKSSTGGLVQAALEQAGYQVGMRQYNRPPTVEQRTMPWMDRFEVPGPSSILHLTPNTADGNESEQAKHIGLVWDRGPAGDFVYGDLDDLPLAEKKRRYEEFIAFDQQCREKDILFLKLLFVTNRDSIAKTLGKRLAQKKMAKDLTTWLQACRSRSGEEDVNFEGIEAISAHIDPTDFLAFNNYQRNLRIFSNFALNTDSEENPWVVVNTGDRYAARKSLMKAFRAHLNNFESCGKGCSSCSGPNKPPILTRTSGVEIHDMMKTKFSRSWRHSLMAWITFISILLLAYIYAENTKWDDSWFNAPPKYNISALLEGGADDDITVLGPRKPSATAEEENATYTKKGKTSKEEKPKLADDGKIKELGGAEAGATPAVGSPPKIAKTAKVAKESKEGETFLDESANTEG
mmetsp:Transcript_39430/g.94839  ORF Transcript_39430/g.94839 Transcript_39430/m.94839 type:complete len:983 (+) Transcript_39430:38-2986(+)